MLLNLPCGAGNNKQHWISSEKKEPQKLMRLSWLLSFTHVYPQFTFTIFHIFIFICIYYHRVYDELTIDHLSFALVAQWIEHYAGTIEYWVNTDLTIIWSIDQPLNQLYWVFPWCCGNYSWFKLLRCSDGIVQCLLNLLCYIIWWSHFPQQHLTGTLLPN